MNEQMTIEEEMEYYFPGEKIEMIAAANPFEMLMVIAMKRIGHEDEEGVHWDIMERIWDHARETVAMEQLDEKVKF